MIGVQIVVPNLPAVGLPKNCESETVDKHTKTPKDDRNQLSAITCAHCLKTDKPSMPGSIFIYVYKDPPIFCEFGLLWTV